MKIFKDKILDLIFPKNIKCLFCRNELNEKSNNSTCEDCLQTLPFIVNPCSKCGSEMITNLALICPVCHTRNYHFIQAKSVFVFRGLPLKVVHNLKYGDKKFLAENMAKYLSEIYGKWNVFADMVTCVPMFPTKEKERGYNQSRLLAEEFSHLSKVKFVQFCDKVIDTPSQTELDTRKRILNVANSFKFRTELKPLIKDKTILIIDDVITTGATTSEVSKILVENGAKECYVLSFAHTSLIDED